MAGGKSKSRRSRRGGRQRHIKVNENPIEFSSNGGHANHVLEQLNLQRLHGGLCDVALVVGGRKFDAHRNVLAACSQYFKSMFENGRFRESKQKEVKIQSLDAEAIEILLEYMYTDSITITFSNVEGIIAASDLFLIQAVRDYCANYWTQTLCVDNVLSAYKNADIYNLSQLRDEAEAFLSKHFTEIVESNEFVNYPYEVVVVMIKSDLIDVDEKDVFLAVKKWVMHAKERVSLLDDLMSRIRLPLMPAADLIECVNVEPLVLKSEWCQALVQEAMNYQLLPNKQGELQTPRSRPRYVNLDEMIFAVGVTGTEGHIPDMLLTKCYIPRHNAWYSLATLHAVSLRGLTFCNGLLYALCFNTENEQLDLYMYDIVSNAWSDGPSINKSNHVIRRSIQLSNTWVQLIECRQKTAPVAMRCYPRIHQLWILFMPHAKPALMIHLLLGTSLAFTKNVGKHVHLCRSY
ncbi:kelch-like protein 20 [Saccoglossus kowalevskii]